MRLFLILLINLLNISFASWNEGLEAYRAQDYYTAFEKIEPVANSNYGLNIDDAQYLIGWFYETGNGVEKDEEEAVKWYKKAANLGSERAQYELGNMYENGRIVEQNDQKALNWYINAAKSPYIDSSVVGSQYRIGVIYEKHEKSYKALEWLLKAANHGHANAQNFLGFMYTNRKGIDDSVKNNDEIAVQWFLKAANKNHIEAQFNLGIMYENGGNGLPVNYKKAIKWYKKSEYKGHKKAKNSIERVKGKIQKQAEIQKEIERTRLEQEIREKAKEDKSKANIEILLYFSVLIVLLLIIMKLFKNNKIIGVVIIIFAIIFGMGMILEKMSKEFQFGMKSRYVEQCMAPMQALGASFALVSEGIELYDINKGDLFLGTTKEQQEKLHVLTEAGYYWIYFNSCSGLKNKKPIERFLLRIDSY